MSTATSVPETYELEGDDALETLRTCGWKQLLTDAFIRFRYADGTSHARALAFAGMMALLPGAIAAVGLATMLRAPQLAQVMIQATDRLAPGPAGDIFKTALEQGQQGASGGAALFFGLVATLAAGAVAMAQIERGANRIYGVEQDRPTVEKYLTGLVLTVSAGGLTVLAFLVIVVGSDLSNGLGLTGFLGTLWSILRWPLSVAFVVTAFAWVFRYSPRRHQPAPSWLAIGSGVAVLLWLIFTGLLAFYLQVSTSFGELYGPLIGVVGMLLWAFLTALALYLGIAFAAQLEAVRAGVPQPTTGEIRNAPSGASRAGTRKPILG